MPGWVGVAATGAVVLLATAAGLLWRARNGQFRTIANQASANSPTTETTLTALGVTPGGITLLQFSSAFCAPCRATRVFCADVAKAVPGVRHVEVDAESHLDEVRALDIWRTPTVLVVDGNGVVRSRASGATNRAQLLTAVADVLSPVAA